MKKYILSFIVLLAIGFVGCQNGNEKSEPQENFSGHKVEVSEVIQGSTYTYVKVSEEGNEYWIATSKVEIDEDGVYYFESGLEMMDFTSKEVDKTFDKILFVDALATQPLKPATPMGSNPAHGRPQAAASKDINIEPAKDGITIAKLFENASSYSGKTVVVKGKVVKFNPQIMGKNWAHIQDGTQSKGVFDLTVTTLANVEVGQIITFKGKVTLDKDFGAGYKYDVIIEEAVIVE